jgi:hypothetical protein
MHKFMCVEADVKASVEKKQDETDERIRKITSLTFLLFIIIKFPIQP